MPIYVCLIFDRAGKAIKVEAFDRPADDAAAAAALSIRRSCGPKGEGYELWCSGRKIVSRRQSGRTTRP
jgi:hypothetical protein